MRLGLYLCVSAFICGQIALAEPQYMLDHVLPRGGTRGTTVDVTLTGKYLTDPKEIVFYDNGIKAQAIKPGAKPSEEVTAKFLISPDAAIGEHVFRIRTATGLSEAVTFWVSKFPTVMELEKKPGENDSIAKAQPIPLNCTVEGEILPGGDMDKDYYWTRFNAGERISVEIESVRLGTLHFGGENDLAVRILDEDGKELGRNDDSAMYVQDPILSVIAPRNGPYYIEIKQQVFYRPQQSRYRAHIGNFSRPTAIFPAGGQSGTTISGNILGDPLGERTEQIALPKTASGTSINLTYFSGNAPTPNILRVSPYPNVLAGDDRVSTLPAAFNGIIAKPGQSDTFHFTAKKGESWKIRVYGRTLGAPIDPKLWVADAKTGKHSLDADDAKLVDIGYPSSRGSWYVKDQMDPVAVFKPTVDGEYILGVEDSRGLASPTSVYRVEVEPLRDSVYNHITMNEGYQIPRLTGMIVPQGGRWTMEVQLAQGLGNNYKGDLQLEANGLPRGVTMIAPVIKKGMNRTPVQFVAAPNAEQQAALVELRLKPVEPNVVLDSGSRQGFALVNRGGEMPLHFVWLDRYAMAVTQPAPFDIELAPPTAPLSQNGELELKVKINRRGEFKDAVEIQTDWLPPSVSKESTVTIPAGKSEGSFHIHADSKAASGTYKIAINASTTAGDAFSGIGRVRVSSSFVELKISEPMMSIDLKRTAVEQGQVSELVGTVKPTKGFTGTATVVLKHLPKGVTMLEPAPKITPQDTTVTFKIKADRDALAGLYKDINCEVTVVADGQSTQQITGSTVLRIDPARTAIATASATVNK